MGGIGKLEPLSIERLARKATQYIYSKSDDNRDAEIMVMGSMTAMKRFELACNQTIDILEKEKNQNKSGCLPIVILMLVSSGILSLFLI